MARKLRSDSTVTSRLFNFVGGEDGAWKITRSEIVCGEGIPKAPRLEIRSGGSPALLSSQSWIFRGIVSNERYVERKEKSQLLEQQEGLGRPASTAAALILIRKSDAWWALSQDERRKIFETDSAHIQIGLKYLPAIARRLHHCRDLAENEPFDFITWFEFDPADEEKFNELVHELRNSAEWKYVEREVEMRAMRAESKARS